MDMRKMAWSTLLKMLFLVMLTVVIWSGCTGELEVANTPLFIEDGGK